MSFNVLIVDGSDLVRASLRRLIALTANAATIREVGSLSEALADVQLYPPALVILDLNLPDGFGWNILESIKEVAPASRIAIFTIHADPEHRQLPVAWCAMVLWQGDGAQPLVGGGSSAYQVDLNKQPQPR